MLSLLHLSTRVWCCKVSCVELPEGYQWFYSVLAHRPQSSARKTRFQFVRHLACEANPFEQESSNLEFNVLALFDQHVLGDFVDFYQNRNVPSAGRVMRNLKKKYVGMQDVRLAVFNNYRMVCYDVRVTFHIDAVSSPKKKCRFEQEYEELPIPMIDSVPPAPTIQSFHSLTAFNRHLCTQSDAALSLEQFATPEFETLRLHQTTQPYPFGQMIIDKGTATAQSSFTNDLPKMMTSMAAHSPTMSSRQELLELDEMLGLFESDQDVSDSTLQPHIALEACEFSLEYFHSISVNRRIEFMYQLGIYPIVVQLHMKLASRTTKSCHHNESMECVIVVEACTLHVNTAACKRQQQAAVKVDWETLPTNVLSGSKSVPLHIKDPVLNTHDVMDWLYTVNCQDILNTMAGYLTSQPITSESVRIIYWNHHQSCPASLIASYVMFVDSRDYKH